MGFELKDIGGLGSLALDTIAILIVAVVTVSLKNLQKYIQEKKATSFNRAINRNARLQNQLSEIRALLDSDRVKLFQIHNGEYFLSGESNMKCSLTHFYVRTGVAIPEGNLQALPTTHFPNLFRRLKENQIAYYPETNTDEQDPTLRHILNVNGVSKAVVYPLQKKPGVWVGFLIVSWLAEDQGYPANTAEVLKDYSQKLTDLMSLQK